MNKSHLYKQAVNAAARRFCARFIPALREALAEPQLRLHLRINAAGRRAPLPSLGGTAQRQGAQSRAPAPQRQPEGPEHLAWEEEPGTLWETRGLPT